MFPSIERNFSTTVNSPLSLRIAFGFVRERGSLVPVLQWSLEVDSLEIISSIGFAIRYRLNSMAF